MRERWWIRPLILLAVVVAGVAVALTVDLPSVDAVRADVAAAGWAGPVLYAAVYTAFVIGTRLVPLLPFTTLNYAYGLSAVRFRDYVLGTAVILAGATAYVTIGAYGATPGSVPFLLAAGGLAVLLAVAGALVARRRRRATAGTEN
jgi:uncharacterized membrane protein YdjX (TVP38/TMEM64 family)